MKLKVGDNFIACSEKIGQLPRDFVDFAISHRGGNGNYFWKGYDYYCTYYQLENIQIVDRIWNWAKKTRALSLKFTFSSPNQQTICTNEILGTRSLDKYCYEHGFVSYDEYYTNIVEAPDIHQFLVQMNLDGTFNPEWNSLIEHQD